VAYALADLNIVKKRTIQILNANQSAYATTVSGSVGAFPYDQEIIDAIFESDEFICNYGYFQSANDSLATPFNVTTAPLADQDPIPFHHGTITKAEVSINTVTFSTNASNVTTTTPAHGWSTGQLITVLATAGGLTALTNYYAIVLSTTTIKFATSLTNALAGTAVSVTNGTTGTIIAWQLGVEAQSLDDVVNATAVGETYVGDGSFHFLYRPQDGNIYTPALYARCTFPEYVRTSALQSRQSEEFLVVCGAVKMLTKNASPAPFGIYAAEFDRGLQQIITDGVYTQQIDSNTNT
jgi:hypothetical protein